MMQITEIGNRKIIRFSEKEYEEFKKYGDEKGKIVEYRNKKWLVLAVEIDTARMEGVIDLLLQNQNLVD